MMLSDVCLTFDAYIEPKSRTERPRKIKIGSFGAEVAHVTRDLHTTFKVKRSKVKVTPSRFTHRRINASGSCSGERGNVLAVENYCYVAVCSAARGASAPTEGGVGRGHIVRPPAYSLLLLLLRLIVSEAVWRFSTASVAGGSET